VKKVEAVVSEDCIFATNTSTLPISELAKASSRPENFIGIHFFSPVEKMLLVEIIKGNYANRCIIPYINEGIRMVKEGVKPALVENAAKLVGMPLGPLQLVDETSIDLGVKIARATRAAMGDAYPDGDVDEVLFWMADQGRLGRKAKAGFYAYDEKGKRLGLWEGLAEKFPPAKEQPDVHEVQHRLLMAQVLEAVRAFEEGVLEDIREGDVGAILGWGFAPWSGGPFSWLDSASCVSVNCHRAPLQKRCGLALLEPLEEAVAAVGIARAMHENAAVGVNDLFIIEHQPVGREAACSMHPPDTAKSFQHTRLEKPPRLARIGLDHRMFDHNKLIIMKFCLGAVIKSPGGNMQHPPRCIDMSRDLAAQDLAGLAQPPIQRHHPHPGADFLDRTPPAVAFHKRPAHQPAKGP